MSQLRTHEEIRNEFFLRTLRLLDNVLKTRANNAGSILATDGTQLIWTTGDTTPAGSNTQVQFNNSGSFGASANLTWASNILTVNGTIQPNLITLAGATSSFPAIKRSATDIHFRLADDSAYTNVRGAVFQAYDTTATIILGNSANQNGLALRDTAVIKFSSTTDATGTADTGIARSAAGVIKATDGSTGYGKSESLYQRFGSGSPEGVVTAPVGAIYHRTDGGTGTSFYVKESGSGNTGWVAK